MDRQYKGKQNSNKNQEAQIEKKTKKQVWVFQMINWRNRTREDLDIATKVKP